MYLSNKFFVLDHIVYNYKKDEKGEDRGYHTMRLQLLWPGLGRLADRRGGDHQKLVEEPGLQIWWSSRRLGQRPLKPSTGARNGLGDKPPWRLTGDWETEHTCGWDQGLEGKVGRTCRRWRGTCEEDNAARKGDQPTSTSSRTCPVHERQIGNTPLGAR
jgi:hypothetical protein